MHVKAFKMCKKQYGKSKTSFPPCFLDSQFLYPEAVVTSYPF